MKLVASTVLFSTSWFSFLRKPELECTRIVYCILSYLRYDWHTTDSCPNLKLHSPKNHTNQRIQRCGKMCKEMHARVSCISEQIIYRRSWSRLKNHHHLQLKHPFLRGQNLNGARPTAAIPCRKRRNQHSHPGRL